MLSSRHALQASCCVQHVCRPASTAVLTQVMSCTLQGSDWNSQIKLGSNQFYGVLRSSDGTLGRQR